MKRISTLLLSAAMLFGAVGAAQAVDIKAKGQFEFAFGWGKNLAGNKGFNSGSAHQDFIARQRVRTQINFIASEALQGVLMFEIGDTDWGRTKSGNQGPSSGGALDADGVNVGAVPVGTQGTADCADLLSMAMMIDSGEWIITYADLGQQTFPLRLTSIENPEHFAERAGK